MGKRILVAGAGHGGLTAAAQLAKAGFDVTVLERHTKETLGYDKIFTHRLKKLFPESSAGTAAGGR